MADDEGKKKKKSRREREKELRDEGLGCGFNKELIADRHRDDQRYVLSRTLPGRWARAPDVTMPMNICS
jgi:hypothetical protein